MHFCHLCEDIVKHFVRTSLQLRYQKNLLMNDKAGSEVCTGGKKEHFVPVRIVVITCTVLLLKTDEL